MNVSMRKRKNPMQTYQVHDKAVVLILTKED